MTDAPTRWIEVRSPLGSLRLVARGGALVAVRLPEDRRPAPDGEGVAGRTEPLTEAARQLDEYFAGRRRAFDLRLAPGGTPFQRAVWEALCAIPFGERRTYRELAESLGRPAAVRAVGAANGRNPLAIVIPCHRVLGAGGALVGFAGGLDAKRWLLTHEARGWADTPLGQRGGAAAPAGAAEPGRAPVQGQP